MGKKNLNRRQFPISKQLETANRLSCLDTEQQDGCPCESKVTEGTLQLQRHKGFLRQWVSNNALWFLKMMGTYE